MTHGDNPAARLEWFLIDFNGRGPSTSIGEATGMVFGLLWPTEADQIFAALSDVIRLGRRTRACIDHLPEDAHAGSFLKHFGEIDAAVDNLSRLMVGTGHQVQHITAHIQPTGWHSLEVAALLVGQYHREPILPDGVVADLIKQTQDLIAELLDSEEINADSRAWMIDKLREVERELALIKLRGYGAVENAANRLVGSLMRSDSIWRRVKSPETLRKLVGLVTALDLALNVASNAQSLTSGNEAPQPSSIVVQVSNQFAVPELPAPKSHPSERTDP